MQGQWHFSVKLSYVCKHCIIYLFVRGETTRRTGCIAHRPLCRSEMHRGRCVKCVYASAPFIPSLYYQTMQLPIGNAGSEFSLTFFRARVVATRQFPFLPFFLSSSFPFLSFLLFFFFLKMFIWSDVLSENYGETRSVEYDKRIRVFLFPFPAGFLLLFFAGRDLHTLGITTTVFYTRG